MQYVQESKDIVAVRLTRLILKVYYRNFCRGILWDLELREVQHQVKHLKWRWQGNLGFWIPGTGFQIFVSGTWSQDKSPVGFQIPWALFRIPKAQDFGFHKQKISRVPESGLDSGFQLLVGFRIPRALFRIPNSKAQDCRFHKQKFPGFRNSGFPYKADLEWRQEEGQDLRQVLQMYLNSYQFFIYKLHCAIYLFLGAADHKSNMLTCVSLILSCYPCPWLHFDWFNRAAFRADYSSNQMLGNGDKLFANFFINVAFQVIVSVCSPAFVREFVEGKKNR